jgi:ATP-dependent DNA ligase
VQAFSELFEELDATTATGVKVAAMVRYFRTAAPADAAWAAYILSGRRLKRFIGPTLLYRWLIDAAALPEWLIEESVAAVGDMAETIALLMEDAANVAATSDVALAEWIEGRLLPLRAAPVEEQHAAIVNWWRTLPYRECFILNKLLTGELRVGVSALLVTRAIAETVDVPRPDIVRRLMGEWQPSKSFWEGLASRDLSSTAASTPYPFFLASPLEGDPGALGTPANWQIEWKWDGIRAQLIRRGDTSFIWSRGEDLITERFPEVAAAAAFLPDGTVLDGELVVWKDGVQPFALLQQRIGRKKLSPAILKDLPGARGAWWKWKIDPYTFDAVMLYAHPGHGRRSNLYTDYTFGVWREGELVPIAKAYSGLSNAEIAELDRWIRAHTLEKFGPNRAVEQSQVFELAYEGIAASNRHKSGIALRFPRILRRRPDKPAAEADTLAALQRVLEAHRGDVARPAE